MNHYTYYRFLIFSFLISLHLFTSCRECDPITVPGNDLIINFYNKSDRSAISPDFTAVYGLGREDSLLVEATGGSYALPLKRSGEFTSFVFEIGGLRDTLDVGYEKRVWINGPECGAFERFEDLGVVGTDGIVYKNYSYPDKSLFDSASILIPEVTADVTLENISVFIDQCDDSRYSPNRDMVIAYIDKETGENRSARFQSIYKKGEDFNPLYDDKDNLFLITLPLEENKTSTTYVFEYFDAFLDTLVAQEIVFHYSNAFTVPSFPTNCILEDATGNIQVSNVLMTDPSDQITFNSEVGIDSVSVEKNFLNGTIFSSNPNSDPTINIDFNEPNIQIFL